MRHVFDSVAEEIMWWVYGEPLLDTNYMAEPVDDEDETLDG